MSLYDDFDKHRNSEKVAGWSSGIKLLQSQLQLKKAVTSVKKESGRKAAAVLAPVIDLKSKSRDLEKEDDGYNKYYTNSTAPFGMASEFDWNVINEYDPAWPNEYEKAVKELREIRDREHHEHDSERKRRRDNPPKEFEREDSRENQMSNIAMNANDRDEERTNYNRPNASGAAIAPPPSLQDSPEIQAPPQPPPPPPPPKQTLNQGYATSTVAEKIMARYGFKAGQGLGKKEQGMSAALQVEKTSKRGGRIIHEKDIPVPLPVYNMSPPSNSQAQPNSPVQDPNEPSITEIMKDPSKVVLLRNMVGPGEVDDEIEPEVKEECNKKYGDVTRVMIHEVIDANPEEAVRIFVEFKRIESAIKAVVDLNGRFFGGRQVKAGFYSLEKLNAYQLLD